MDETTIAEAPDMQATLTLAEDHLRGVWGVRPSLAVSRQFPKPVAEDDRLFNTAMVSACAHWALAYTVGLWHSYLKTRLEQGEAYDAELGISPSTISLTRKVAGYWRACIAVSEEHHMLPGLRATMGAILTATESQLGELEPLPGYPAFE